MNFRFDCNSSDVIYLISCTVCGLQYMGTTVNRFRERFNHYSQGVRGVMQEKMISQFCDFEGNGSFDGMYIQITDHCDPNDKERRESLWIETRQTMHLFGLSFKL